MNNTWTGEQISNNIFFLLIKKRWQTCAVLLEQISDNLVERLEASSRQSVTRSS